ncbi:MAG: SDR family oxidoreductase [Robiginitomaculum sp.]|nr:SDR family oxidoreductase [Robiginitomaculum sp.]
MYSGQSIAITGAGGGIGRAIAEKFIKQGAKVAISDIDTDLVKKTADEIGAVGFSCDVTDEQAIIDFIKGAEAANGPIDVFVANAGVGFPDQPGGHAAGGSNESWETSWQIHVMSSVYASRALLPGWIRRGQGRFVIVASAAGLLAQIFSGSYTATKHAAVAFAEYLAMMHKDDGLKVHCVCPQYVKTNMTKGMEVVKDGPDIHLEASDVADSLFAAMEADKFLVLPHPVIAEYQQAKLADIDRYIASMAYRKKITDSGHIPGVKET